MNLNWRRITIAILLLATFSNSVIAAVGNTVSVKMSNITFTWTFDKPVTYGYFVDGQPWMIAPVDGVNLISAIPARINGASVFNTYSGAAVKADINITVVNPHTATYYVNKHFSGLFKQRNVFGWDSRGAIRYGLGLNYNAAAGWDGLTPKPLVAGDIVTTAKSITESTTKMETCLEAVAVLTVLAAEPPADAFRPGVTRNSARRANPEFIRKSDIISNLSDYYISKPKVTLYDKAIADLEPDKFLGKNITKVLPGPNIMLAGQNENRSFHAVVNDTSSAPDFGVIPRYNVDTYGGSLATDLGNVAIGALASWLTPQERDTCQVHLIQRAIDTYESLLDSLVLSFDGGHIEGYGALLTIAGKMLNNSGMLGMNQSINGVAPMYFLSDYGQAIYIDNTDIDHGDGTPPPGDPRRIKTTSTFPGQKYGATPYLNNRELLLAPGVTQVNNKLVLDPSFQWLKYRAHLEVQNLKFKIVSGAGASDQYYVVTDFSNFYLNGVVVTTVNTSTDYITGGTLTVKPAWVNGVPDATSKIITYVTADYETPCWGFKSGGVNGADGLYDYDYSLSPVTDYGSIVAGAHVALFTAMYAIGGDAQYRGGLDKWMIGAMTQPGYGEVLFSKSYKGDFLTYAGSNSLMIMYPNAITSVKASPFLSGLWKEKVMDKVGAKAIITNNTINSLIPGGFNAIVPTLDNRSLADFHLIKTAVDGEFKYESSSIINLIEVYSLTGMQLLKQKVGESSGILSLPSNEKIVIVKASNQFGNVVKKFVLQK